MKWMGLEPINVGVKNQCLTYLATTVKKKHSLKDLNLQPLFSKNNTLPIKLREYFSILDDWIWTNIFYTQNKRTTIMLRPEKCIEKESNLQPPDYETGALPLSYRFFLIMLVEGLEPTNQKVTNFESAASTIPPYKPRKIHREGIEPSISCLSDKRFTIKLSIFFRREMGIEPIFL